MSESPLPESWKLFVGQIPRSTRLEELINQFGIYGELHEVFLIKDPTTGTSRGCCFVRYKHRASAERCIEVLNDKMVFPGATNPLQVSYTNLRQPHFRILVSNLLPIKEEDGSNSNEDVLRNLLADQQQPNDIVLQPNGTSAIVTFTDMADTTRAINLLNGAIVGSSGQVIKAEAYVKPSSVATATLPLVMPTTVASTAYKLFVGGLTPRTTESQLLQLFSTYGKVIEVVVLRYPNGQSKLSGFVKYASEHEANLAIDTLSDQHLLRGSPRPLTVRMAAPSPPPENKLFVGHLPLVFNENQTKDLFSKFGELIEVHVMRDTRTGYNKGSAFVKFAHRAHAEAAIAELNGSLDFGQIPLKVSFAVSRSAAAAAAASQMFPPFHRGRLVLPSIGVAVAMPHSSPTRLGFLPQSPSNQHTTFYHPVVPYLPPPLTSVPRYHRNHPPSPLVLKPQQQQKQQQEQLSLRE